jgi:carbon-monoxide dehydrogenase medium subunit
MKLWNKYHTPVTVDQTLSLLAQYNGAARIVAGGTDLLVDAHADEREPFEALIDITGIKGLCHITADDSRVTIGAGVTHTQIVQNQVLRSRATCLVESCGVVGGPQVRNVATLGGNVVHALPAGDGTVSLVALDAIAEVIQKGERQHIPIVEMYRGPGVSLLVPGRDFLLSLHFNLCGKNEASAFKRIMRPQGVALPILGCAVWVRLDETLEEYEAVRVCIAPVGPTPRRITEVEDSLVGQPVNEESLAQAIAVAQKAVSLRTSRYRATAAYRQEMVAVLLRRTLPLAIERARSGEAVPEGIGV